MRPQVGQVINNKYRLIRVIGDGGMGSVLEARHEVLGTTVALKFLHPELSRRQGLVQRFLQEARVSAQIQSPHVVRVMDVDQNSAGQAFIVMEYLEGQTLQTLYEDLYRAGKRLSYADALEYAMQMLEGVEAAHKAGVVHRDLKPDNVMITRGSRGEPLIKLLDFGIAKLKVTGELDRGLTRPGVIMGTPEYMAPEQAYSADKVDVRADIFSLGVMIFEMLAGRRPVGGDEPHQIAGAYLSGHVSRLSELAPHLAPELCSAIHKAIAPMPPERFSSVAEMREAIETFARAVRVPSALTPAPTGVSQVQTPAPAVAAAAAVAAAVPPTASGAGSAEAASAVPAASALDNDAPRGVPRTIPPEDEQPSADASLAARPAQSSPPPYGMATPLGGFSVGASPVPAGMRTETPDPSRASGPAFSPVDGGLPATVSAVPYPPPNGSPGGTVSAPYEPPQRPGGTAVGAAPFFGDPSAQRPDARPPYASGPQGFGGTAPMDPLPLRGPDAGRRPQRTGPSMVLILLAAAGIAGAVVGGVYFAQQVRKGDETVDTRPIVELPPSTTLPSEPTPPPPTGAGVDPTPTTPATTKTPPKPTGTTKTQPTSTGTGTAPTPSGTTTGTPTQSSTGGPVIIIPSNLPTNWPLPMPFPTAQPTQTSPGPTSTGTSTGPAPTTTGTRKRIEWPPR